MGGCHGCVRVNGNEDQFGRKRFKLGVVELGVVALGLGVCGWLISHQYSVITDTQATQTTQVSALVTQVAVMNEQLKTLTLQLADVPANTKAIATLQAQELELDRRVRALEHERPP